MAAIDESQLDWVDSEDDPLVARLRALRWAPAPDEVRERCWQRIRERVAELKAEKERPPVDPTRRDQCERNGFTRPLALRRPALAQTLSRSFERRTAVAQQPPLLRCRA
jgi:hypothetical protein